MKMMKKIVNYLTLLVALLLLGHTTSSAQNIVSLYGGYGSGGDSIYPEVEGRSVYGLPNIGVSWRNYTAEQNIGCFGIDFEYLQRGFSFTPNTSTLLEDEEALYYTRWINSIVVPIVWQPYVYMFDRRVRVFFEASVTFSYDVSSHYVNEFGENNYDEWEGKYEYENYRDNHFGYGLAFGGGMSYLVGERFEVMARVRYYLGLSDVVRNRNKYYTNNLDGAENPFTLTPIRSSLTNLIFNVGIGYHFGEKGFKAWKTKRVKTPKMNDGFNYKGEAEGSTSRDGNRSSNRGRK